MRTHVHTHMQLSPFTLTDMPRRCADVHAHTCAKARVFTPLYALTCSATCTYALTLILTHALTLAQSHSHSSHTPTCTLAHSLTYGSGARLQVPPTAGLRRRQECGAASAQSHRLYLKRCAQNVFCAAERKRDRRRGEAKSCPSRGQMFWAGERLRGGWELAGPEQGGEFVSSVFNLCLEISDTALYSCI